MVFSRAFDEGRMAVFSSMARMGWRLSKGNKDELIGVLRDLGVDQSCVENEKLPDDRTYGCFTLQCLMAGIGITVFLNNFDKYRENCEAKKAVEVVIRRLGAKDESGMVEVLREMDREMDEVINSFGSDRGRIAFQAASELFDVIEGLSGSGMVVVDVDMGGNPHNN